MSDIYELVEKVIITADSLNISISVFLLATVQYTKVYVETVVNEILKDWH